MNTKVPGYPTGSNTPSTALAYASEVSSTSTGVPIDSLTATTARTSDFAVVAGDSINATSASHALNVGELSGSYLRVYPNGEEKLILVINP